MSSSGETKPPDLPTGRVTATATTPIDLARVVVKPTALQDNTVAVTAAATSVTVTAQTTHLALPRVQPSTSVISATATAGQSIFTPAPSPASHLIVPSVAAAKGTTLRPSIRPLQPAPVIGTNVQKIIATPTITPQGVKAPTVVPHVRSPVVPVQQTTVQPVAQSQQNKQRPTTPAASLIRASNQFTTHVPRGPATVASITAGPKTAVATPIIRQTTGQNVVLASSHIPVGARASAAALTPARAYAPVTMVELSKTQQSAGQLHLGIPPSITIEPGVRSTVSTGPKQTVYTPAIFQPIVSTGEKTGSTTAFYKTTGAGAPAQFNKGTTTFTPITTSQPQAVVQPVSNAPTSQAVTITSKVTVTNSNQFSKVASPVFVSNKANVSNVVITSQRPVRNVSTTQVTTTPNANNLTIPMAKVFQQPLTVTGSEIEAQPQPIGFMTAAGPRLQLPVISVGQNVQGTSPGTVVLTGDASRGSGTTQYMQPGTFLRYETFPASAYFGGQGGASTPVHLTTAIPGVRTNSPFSSQRSLMVTVDAKVHPGTSSNNVISVTATKANNHTNSTELNSAQTTFNPDIAAGLQRISSETTITKLATPPPPSITVSAVPTPVVDRVTTTVIAEPHSTKLANLTEKVITQALSGTGAASGTAVGGASLSNAASGTLSLPITVTGIPSSTSASANQVATILPTNQQATQGSPSRPSILRKRPASTADHFNALVASSAPPRKDSKDDQVLFSIKQEVNAEDASNSTPGNSASSNDNHHGAQNGQVSPRKKPRKQLLQSSEIEGEARSVRREENGKDDNAAINQRPQLFGGQQHGWKARLNHFLRHSDVRCRDDRKPSVNELANQKSAAQRAHGWKLFHIKGQVEEVETIESDAVHRFKKMLEDFEASSKATERSTFGPDEEKMLNKIADLIKGNLQRSKIMQDQMIEVKKQLSKVLEHKGRVLDVIGKHVSKRPLKKREKL
ncbi:histone deacetylase complex subunit SAP130 [Galendromus occidentalis]|uniref:Histone deacetylase complex subunit SAP130 n=1 Tax=Galendromus occidentalis TaxID=34638 RepID=A0AAJ7WHE4_9ACAR|nr:histone deacetylase complex subunit SAP130 [Galendromus occidentalis]